MEKLGRPRRRCQLPLAVATVLGAAAVVHGCSGSEERGAAGAPGFGGITGNAGSGAAPTPAIPNGGSGGAAPLPPEEEKENRFELPVLSGRWVWSANPESGRVAVIDTATLGVRLARAGFAPTYLAALRAEGNVESAAIVLNARSHDATLMRLVDGALETHRVATHVGANSWAVSPSGRWAIAWSDASVVKNPDRAESFQDITVIDTSGVPRGTRLSVGFRPSRVFVQTDEARAFVVTEVGISVVELAGAEPTVSRDVAVSEDPNARALDISVVPSGTHAVVRTDGSPRVGVIELDSGRRTEVTLSGPVSDLDLVADGSAALVVVRGRPLVTEGSAGMGGIGQGGEGGVGTGGASGAGGTAVGGASGNAGGLDAGGAGAGTGGAGTAPPASGFGPSEVAILPIPEITADPERFDRVEIEELIGSVAVSADGGRAVLYTTAVGHGRVLVLPTRAGEPDYLTPRAVRVRAPVDGVFIAPDAEHAVVALEPEMGSALRGAFGVISLTRALSAKIEPTDAPITGVAFGAPPTRAALLTAATGLTAYLVQLPSLRVDAVALPSLPLAAGVVVDEGVAYVAQEHPEGRLSLIELESGQPRTLTGFELAARVMDGH